MERTLAILDRDSAYGETLLQFIKRSGQLNMQIQVFTSFEVYLAQAKDIKVELLLVNESFLSEMKAGEVRKEQILLLLEDKGHLSADLPGIYKYQSAQMLLKELREVIGRSEVQEKTKETADGRQMIRSCVFSPTGEAATFWAMQLCQYLGETSRVLYVNLHPFADPSRFGTGNQKGMSEVLYYLKQKNETLPSKWESLIQKGNGYDVLGPVAHYRDLFELHEAELADFLAYLHNHTVYEQVVFDIGVFGDAFPLLLAECKDIYLRQESDGESACGYEVFCRHLREGGGEDMLGKIKTFQIQKEQ